MSAMSALLVLPHYASGQCFGRDEGREPDGPSRLRRTSFGQCCGGLREPNDFIDGFGSGFGSGSGFVPPTEPPADCNPSAYAVGDPHFMTWDDLNYEFHGKCDYTVAKAASPGPVNYEVQSRHTNGVFRTMTAAVVVELPNDERIEIRGNPFFSGAPVDQFRIRSAAGVWSTYAFSSGSAGADVRSGPTAHPSYTTSIYSEGSGYSSRYVVELNGIGLKIVYDGIMNLHLYVSDSPAFTAFHGTSGSRLQGLFGNYDGDSADDLSAINANCAFRQSGSSSLFELPDPGDPVGECSSTAPCTMATTFYRRSRKQLDDFCNSCADEDAAREALCEDLAPGGPFAVAFPLVWNPTRYQDCLCDYCLSPNHARSNLHAMEQAAKINLEVIYGPSAPIDSIYDDIFSTNGIDTPVVAPAYECEVVWDNVQNGCCRYDLVNASGGALQTFYDDSSVQKRKQCRQQCNNNPACFSYEWYDRFKICELHPLMADAIETSEPSRCQTTKCHTKICAGESPFSSPVLNPESDESEADSNGSNSSIVPIAVGVALGTAVLMMVGFLLRRGARKNAANEKAEVVVGELSIADL